jgi:pSer/pThr/pTyr-binding forkhead associated (FHA) protein
MYLTNSASYDVRLSQEAFFGARSGINDAFLRIIRDKNFSSSGYNLVVGRVNVNIIVEKNSNFSTITAKGTLLNREKIMQGIVSIDQETGEVVLFSLQEI